MTAPHSEVLPVLESFLNSYGTTGYTYARLHLGLSRALSWMSQVNSRTLSTTRYSRDRSHFLLSYLSRSPSKLTAADMLGICRFARLQNSKQLSLTRIYLTPSGETTSDIYASVVRDNTRGLLEMLLLDRTHVAISLTGRCLVNHPRSMERISVATLPAMDGCYVAKRISLRLELLNRATIMHGRNCPYMQRL